MPIISDAPRLADKKARPVIQPGILRLDRKNSEPVLIFFFSDKLIVMTIAK